MARPTHVYTIEYVAMLIGENLELVQEIASNSDNIDYGEMIHAHDGSEEGITTFTDRGIESLKCGFRKNGTVVSLNRGQWFH